MRKYIKAYFLLCLIPLLANISFAEEDIIIESRFFKGSRREVKQGPEVVISSFSDPIIIPVRKSKIESERKSISWLKNKLNTIYQLKNVDHLATGNVIWDGRKESLNGTVLLENYLYTINIYPRMFSMDNVDLRIEVFKFEVKTEKRRRPDLIKSIHKIPASEGEKILDTEININLDEPVVLGFPSNGNPYFLSIYVTEKKTKGEMGGVFLAGLAEMDIIQLPKPIHKITPTYPEKCKKEKIEGLVILEVSTDEGGNVINVRVLKHAHPRLDRAAREALVQWTYEPVLNEGKPIPVIFAVAVDFRLRTPAKGQIQESYSKDQNDLDEILEKCAEYCEKLANSALFFVCQENIKEEIYHVLRGRGVMVVSGYSSSSSTDTTSTGTSGTIVVSSRIYREKYPGPRFERNTYVYDYQLVKKGEKIEERRTLLEENGEKKNEKNAPLKTKRFYSKKSVFGPVGLLSREWHELYNYKILGKKSIKGREAFVIEAKPKKKIEDKPNYGKIWVDTEDFSILKIEIKQESLAGYEKLKEELKDIKKMGIKPVITIIHEYGIEKNGIRFPSKTTFKEDYVGVNIRRAKKSRLTVTYDDYKFFTVETEVKY